MSEDEAGWAEQVATAFASGDEAAALRLATLFSPPDRNTRELIKQEIMDAAMGDDDATTRLAHRLSGGRPPPKDPDPEFFRAAWEHRNDPRNSELYDDPEMHAEFVEYDSQLAEKAPNLLPAQRLAVAGEIVRKRGGAEDRVIDDGLELLTKSGRTVHRYPAPNAPREHVPDVEEQDRIDAIAAMGRSRMPHQTSEEERAHARRLREFDAQERRRRGSES